MVNHPWVIKFISYRSFLVYCYAETLRKYPPVLAGIRITSKDYNNEALNVKLAKGTYVIVPIFAVHRDPEHFPDPAKFKPERFAKNSQCPYNT